VNRLAAIWTCASALAIGAESTLTALDGARVALSSVQKTPVTVLLFLSAQCPVSNHYIGRANALARAYAGRVTFLGVNSNRNEPLEQIRQHAADYRLAFSVYQDPGNQVADLLEASLTPEAVVVGAGRRVIYRGRIDNHENPVRVTRQDLRLAIEAALAGQAAPAADARAFGCTIKRVERPGLLPIDEAGYPALLASHRGKVVLVSFWATWCEPCRREMPALVAIEGKLRQQGLVLITISADEAEQTAAAAELLGEHRAPHPWYLKQPVDDDAFVRAVSAAWRGGLPALFLYDREGKLAGSFLGETEMATIEGAVGRLLR